MGRNATAYDEDFTAWLSEQAALLRAGRLEALDRENVAEELEDMGKSQRNALRSCLTVLIMHLLKWQHQPGHRSRSWASTINVHRDQAADILADSPSLRRELADGMALIYRRAVRRAASDTGLPPDSFPAACPYTPEEILDEDFLPADQA